MHVNDIVTSKGNKQKPLLVYYSICTISLNSDFIYEIKPEGFSLKFRGSSQTCFVIVIYIYAHIYIVVLTPFRFCRLK